MFISLFKPTMMFQMRALFFITIAGCFDSKVPYENSLPNTQNEEVAENETTEDTATSPEQMDNDGDGWPAAIDCDDLNPDVHPKP